MSDGGETMSERQIDALARMLADGLPRRRLLGGLAAGLTLSLVGRPRQAVLAGCAKVGKRCDKDKDCCEGADCKSGECKCKQGRDECNGKCYDLDKDEKHCGSCDTTCAAGEKCRDGICIGEGGCPAGADSCLGGPAVSCGDDPNCGCVQSVTGETRCADFETDGSAVCGTCESDADCAALGPTAFCSAALLEQVGCCPLGTGNNRCLLPCPA
jgi:hypothetical protein